MTIAYYFNAFLTGWNNNPEYMADNFLTTYASTSSTNDLEWMSANNCPGTDLGTITKVEIRVYGYGDGDDRIDIQPVFGALPGDIHQTTPGTGPPGTWSGYLDITTDTNAPSPWLWIKIVSLKAYIKKITVSKGNMMYAAKVEIRVTYTPSAGGATRSYGYIF